MVYKMAVLGGSSGRVAYTIGKNDLIEVDEVTQRKETPYKLKGENEELIPTQRVVGSKLI